MYPSAVMPWLSLRRPLAAASNDPGSGSFTLHADRVSIQTRAVTETRAPLEAIARGPRGQIGRSASTSLTAVKESGRSDLSLNRTVLPERRAVNRTE